MEEKRNKVYRFDSLDEYSFKERIMIRSLDLIFFFLVAIIGLSMRFEVEGGQNFKAIEAAGRLPIYSFWHNDIFSATYFFRQRGIVVMSSKSADGEYIARFIKRFGYGTIRGSSTRGGVGALVEMIHIMKQGFPAAFTLDGPKGPPRIAKPGPVMLAKKTGNPIMPFVVESRSRWVINSWDRLRIPKPFTKALVIIGEPIYVPPDADDDQIEEYRQKLQKTLERLCERGENWRNA